MLEGDPDLERNMKNSQDTEKILLYILSYTMRRQALFKLLLIWIFLQKQKHFNS